uniref:Uncharacterized protein n=1 Tax=Oncorhynchus tshawytscha TaxID=74940 RepID=A0A8C8H1Y9_ONCTS
MTGSQSNNYGRERMGWFPELFAQCTGGAAVYGKRVTASTTGRQELRKDLSVRSLIRKMYAKHG